jgi:hypothetical protein
LIEADVYEAVCYVVADIGTEYSELWDNDSRKVVVIWEIPSQRIEIPERGNLPRVISKRYNISTHKKANLRKDCESWRGRPFTEEEIKAFELKNLLGASCRLNIIQKPKNDGTMKNEVGAVLPLKGKKLVPENPMVLYGIEENGLEIPAGLPPWVAEAIKKSPEYAELANPHDESEPPLKDEDIPF